MRHIDLDVLKKHFADDEAFEIFVQEIKSLLAENDMVAVTESDKILCYLVSPAWMKAHGMYPDQEEV